MGLLVGLVVLAALVSIGAFALSTLATPTPAVVVVLPGTTQPAAQPSATTEPPTLTPSQTPTASATFTPAPTSTPPTLPPTITRVVPTPTVPVTGQPTLNVTPSPVNLATVRIPGAPTSAEATSAQALPTFAPTALTGEFDLLKDLAQIPTTKINQAWFGPAEDGWQLGTDSIKNITTPVIVRLGPDILTQLYGLEAAGKLTRMDLEMVLVSYDKSLLPTGQVVFGAGFENLRGQRASVQGVLVQTNVLTVGTNLNGIFTRRTQVAVTDVKVKISAQRNKDGTLTLFKDGQIVGTSAASYGAGTALNVYVYTGTGGIVMKITSLKVKLE